MTAREFVIWLKGVIVASPTTQPNEEQWKVIREEVEKVIDVPRTANKELLKD